MYVGLKQPRGDGERYDTPARAAAKETMCSTDWKSTLSVLQLSNAFFSPILLIHSLRGHPENSESGGHS